MTGIERLRELAGGINPRSVWSVTRDEYDKAHGLDVEHKGGQLCDLLADIADQIEREHDVSDREEHDAAAWVREHGGLDEVRKLARHETKEEVELVALGELRHLAGVRQGEAASISKMRESIARRLVPEGCEWYGSLLRIRTAENVDYDGETLFVLIGGRDE